MAENKEFQAKIQRIGTLVAALDQIADEEARSSARTLMQLLMDLHAEGLERILQTISKDNDGEAGQRIIDNLGGDPLVGSLLVLYGLHPLDFESRVMKAIEKVSPQVRKGGGELQLLGLENGNVRVRLEVQGHGCGSTAKTLKAAVEDAIYEAAPDMSNLVIEG